MKAFMKLKVIMKPRAERDGFEIMKLAFTVKHWAIWLAGWLCDTLGVSRGGFLTLDRSGRRATAFAPVRRSVWRTRVSFVQAIGPQAHDGGSGTYATKGMTADCIGSGGSKQRQLLSARPCHGVRS